MWGELGEEQEFRELTEDLLREHKFRSGTVSNEPFTVIYLQQERTSGKRTSHLLVKLTSSHRRSLSSRSSGCHLAN